MYKQIRILHDNKKISMYKDQIYHDTITDDDYYQYWLDHECVVILAAVGLEDDYDFDGIANYLNSLENINTIAFFFDDVFRIKYPHDENCLASHWLEKDLINCEIEEIIILKRIISKIPNKNFEFYHCEKNPNQLLIYQFPQYKFNYFDHYFWESCNYYTFCKPRLNFKYTLSCLNHRNEMFRQIIVSLIKDGNTHYSICNTSDYRAVINNDQLPLKKFSRDIQNKLRKTFSLPPRVLKGKDIILEAEHLGPEHQHGPYIPKQIQKAFVNITTETRFCSPMPYASEKSLKPVIAGRPFILLSTPGTLKLLKDLGFKTFDHWWDESYDEETDHCKRLEKVYRICQDLLAKNNSQLYRMLVEMNPILEHNFNNLKNVKNNMIKISKL